MTTRPSVHRGPTITIGLEVTYFLREDARRSLEKARADALPPDIVESLERIAVEGDAIAAASLKPRVSNEVSKVDDESCVPIEWVSVKAAARILSRTTQNVGKLAKNGSLHAEQDGRSWRVCSASVAARLEGTTCQHQ